MSASADKKKKSRGAPKQSKTVGRTSSLFSIEKKRRISKKGSRRTTKRHNHTETAEWLHWIYSLLIVSLVSLGAYLFLIKPFSYRWKPCYGSKEYEICIPNGYSVYGIDVSHHQGRIDWKRVAASSEGEYPLRFVMLKATEGGDYKDSTFDANIDSARQAGLICGAYHFYNPDTSPIVQADFFTKNVELFDGDLPPVVDIESRGNDIESLQRDLLKWLSVVENYYGIRPIIYTSVKFRKKYLDNPAFDKYQFWIAHYYVEKPETESEWTFWQCSDRARIGGIDGHTDLNVFSGSLSDLQEILF